MKEHYRAAPLMAIDRCTNSFFCKYSPVFCLPEKPYDEKKTIASEEKTDSDPRADLWKPRVSKILTYVRDKYGVKKKEVLEAVGLIDNNIHYTRT